VTARAERQDYLSLVIHELRNPLVGIDAAARVLSRELGGHPARQRASSIASEAQHLLGLLESLADAEAAAAGRLRSSPRPIDLAALVRETVDLQGDGHPITVRGADRPVPVDADARRIRQVLANLLANAQQYSPPGSPIDVAVEAGRGTARVEVRDRGPGIPAAERRRLFRKFARLSTADGTRGSGLGLYICRAIVEDHRGEIRYEAPKGGGSVFAVELPLKKRRASPARALRKRR